MNKKYEILRNCCINHDGVILYKIRALRDFGDVKAGQLGGWIKSEGNLSQWDTCWVYDNAKVFGYARVHNSACIKDNAVVRGDSLISECACVSGYAYVENANIYGNAKVTDFAKIIGEGSSLNIFDNALIEDNACVTGMYIKVHENAHLCEYTCVIHETVPHVVLRGSCTITGKSYIHSGIIEGNVIIRDSHVSKSTVTGNVQLVSTLVTGDSVVMGETPYKIENAMIILDGCITSSDDVLTIPYENTVYTAYMMQCKKLVLVINSKTYSYDAIVAYIKNRRVNYEEYAFVWSVAAEYMGDNNQRLPMNLLPSNDSQLLTDFKYKGGVTNG